MKIERIEGGEPMDLAGVVRLEVGRNDVVLLELNVNGERHVIWGEGFPSTLGVSLEPGAVITFSIAPLPEAK